MRFLFSEAAKGVCLSKKHCRGGMLFGSVEYSTVRTLIMNDYNSMIDFNPTPIH